MADIEMPPGELVGLEHDAIVTGRFWIVTDDQFAAPTAERNRSIGDRANPPTARDLAAYLPG